MNERKWACACQLAMFLLAGMAGSAPAQTSQKIVSGENSVIVEGNAAARAGDGTDQGKIITEGSSNVFIGGKPAATAGAGTDCGGAVIGGSSSVFVNGKPLATAGSSVVPCKQ